VSCNKGQSDCGEKGQNIKSFYNSYVILPLPFGFRDRMSDTSGKTNKGPVFILKSNIK